MSHPEAGATRRRRLLEAVQGRTLEEAYRSARFRADLEAEADRDGPEALVTRGMLEHFRELIAAKAGATAEVAAKAGAGEELFGSTDTVVIVPGFLASSLSDVGEARRGRIWLSPRVAIEDEIGALELGAYDGSEADRDPGVRIVPTGALPILYDLLRLALEVRRYATEIFAVDWRKDLDFGARRLAWRLRELSGGRRPVHLVAHSQGALVARRALQRLGPGEARRIVRDLVLLGPANFGSFSAALALGGGHSLLPMARKLAVEPTRGFQRVLASMSGIYQLLPWDRERVPWLAANGPGEARFWRSGIDVARLERFFGWGRRVDSAFFDDRTTVIVGDNHGEPTVGGVAFDGPVLREAAGFGLAGDGTVPHSCAVLPGTRTFLARGTEHSMLAASRGVIEGVLDVLAGRPVGLPAISSDPSAHLATAVAGRPMAAREAGLNGTFLKSYGGGGAEPEASAVRRHRRDQLREEARRVELQSSVAGRDPGPPRLELILDASNLLPFDFLRTGDRLGRAVVKILRADGAAGTGFLVGPGILLTNHHVLPDVATAASATAVANYEASPPPPDDPIGLQKAAPLDPKGLFLTNADLDFTFCAVRGLDFLGVVPLNRDSLNVLRSESVNIIQHPRGRPKEVALQDNRVVRADNVVLQYSCDTEPGSSGSPVFNNQWKLVALHHASVAVDGPDGRPSPDADPGVRYLNEGIRLSAIAAWLETSDAAGPEDREVVARLRSIFRGLDPQIGYFGALGRKADGRTAAEVVVDTYRGVADVLDAAYWDLRGLGRSFRDRLDEVARVVADMRLDLWCLALPGADAARALCDHLETNFQLDYAAILDPEGPAGDPAILHRRSRSLSVERLSLGGPGPLAATARLATRRGEVVAVHVVSAGPAPDPGALSLVEAIGRRDGPAAADWLLMGASGAPAAPRDLLDAAGHDALVLASAPDGAVVWLSGPSSPVDQVFASPNLDPVSGRADLLVPARDREFPRAVDALGAPRPVALRLSVHGGRSPSPTPPVAAAPPTAEGHPQPPPPAPSPNWPGVLDDAALERRLRAILGPMLAQMLGASRGDAVAARE